MNIYYRYHLVIMLKQTLISPGISPILLLTNYYINNPTPKQHLNTEKSKCWLSEKTPVP